MKLNATSLLVCAGLVVDRLQGALGGDLLGLGDEPAHELLLGDLVPTSPFTIRNPWPLPAAIPRSASRASPGPFTTQPMTATRIGDLEALLLERRVDLLGQAEHVDLGPAARRAGHQVEPSLAQPERLQDPACRP